MDDSDSELSSLSSALSDVDEAMTAKLEADILENKKVTGIGKYFKPKSKAEKTKPATPEPPKRAPSPPHEFVLADKDSIAFIVMFRSRFSDCFAKSLPHYGPQDIERGISGEQPDDQVEHLLCALLSLCLNRKKPVERGHYGRALEDCVAENKPQWPRVWNGSNPLSGGKTFQTMTADERLFLLKTIVLWSLHSSEAVSAAIKGAYKQQRREDDRNQPKAVQPWFSDSWRRKYYLIEGQEDTHFRIYRENDGKLAKSNVWFSVAGTIDEANALADKFESEMPGNQGRLIADKVRMAVPRWEAGEEKRRRKDYRAARKAAFSRPEPGFSLYEGRTRGKRARYTYDNDEDFEGDSSRPASERSTPFDEGRPVITASGRQVKSRLGGVYGESMLTDQRRDTDRERATSNEDTDDVVGANGRPVRKSIPTQRAAAARGRYADGLESESESDGDAAEVSGEEWSGNEDELDDESEPEPEPGDSQDSGDDLMDEADGENTQESLVVQLRYRKAPIIDSHMNGTNVSVEKTRSPLIQVQNASNGTELTRSGELPVGTENGVNGTSLKIEALTNASNGETKSTTDQEAERPSLVRAPVTAINTS